MNLNSFNCKEFREGRIRHFAHEVTKAFGRRASRWKLAAGIRARRMSQRSTRVQFPASTGKLSSPAREALQVSKNRNLTSTTFQCLVYVRNPIGTATHKL